MANILMEKKLSKPLWGKEEGEKKRKTKHPTKYCTLFQDSPTLQQSQTQVYITPSDMQWEETSGCIDKSFCSLSDKSCSSKFDSKRADNEKKFHFGKAEWLTYCSTNLKYHNLQP